VSWVTDECFGYQRSLSMLKKLCAFAINLAAVEELPVIIAGTFRVTFDDACDIIPEELSCFSYRPRGPRRALRASSYFITSRGASMFNLDPVNTANIDFSMDRGPKDHWLNPEDAFYCDPVLATVDFDPDDEETGSETSHIRDDRDEAEIAKMADVGDHDSSRDDLDIPSGLLRARRSSSYNNIYYDEDMLDAGMLCTLS